MLSSMKRHPKDHVLYVRISAEMNEALDKYVEQSKVPEMGKARAVRAILAKALELKS